MDERDQPAESSSVLSPIPKRPPQSTPPPIYLRDWSVPVRVREPIIVLVLIVLADWWLYRCGGPIGWVLFIGAAVPLLAFGMPNGKRPRAAIVTVLMLAALLVDMVWLSDLFHVLVGLTLLGAFTLAFMGESPFLLRVGFHIGQAIVAGLGAFPPYFKLLGKLFPALANVRWLSVGLPLAAVLGFGILFAMANPDLLERIRTELEYVLEMLDVWLFEFLPGPVEVFLWVIVAAVAAGLMRPLRSVPQKQKRSASVGESRNAETREKTLTLYEPIRNMLWGVVSLFAVYLAFEFSTLWFREFPEGFHYSGYAHQGAFWLTVALAVATAVLSFALGETLREHPRFGRLLRLGWAWSALNVLLAISVYNRLLIYVRFNGMTWMRTVGLFGISTVLAGFLLVMWKIRKRHDFHWLIQHQLWAVAVAVYLFLITPVDYLVYRYNVNQVLAGNLAPAVQIAVHPVDDAGMLPLFDLARSPDPSPIREGVRAMLALRFEQMQHDQNRGTNWTDFQLATKLLRGRLRETEPLWDEYRSASPVARNHNDDSRYAAVRSYPNEFAWQRLLDEHPYEVRKETIDALSFFGAYTFQWY